MAPVRLACALTVLTHPLTLPATMPDRRTYNFERRRNRPLEENSDSDMDLSKIITIEPGKRSGKPCVRGLRITVQDILEYLAAGMTEQEILVDFSELTTEDIRACLSFAAARERMLLVAPA
jgi:uncharacterized protein (DUF433 family)